MKKIILLLICFSLISCVTQQIIPFSYHKPTKPIVIPIEPRYIPYKSKTILEIFAVGSFKFTAWSESELFQKGDFFVLNVSLNKMSFHQPINLNNEVIYPRKIFSPWLPLKKEKILLNHKGERLRTESSSPAFQGSNAISRHQFPLFMDGLAIGFSQHKPNHVPVKTGDYLFWLESFEVGFKIAGYGSYNNEIVIVTHPDEVVITEDGTEKHFTGVAIVDIATYQILKVDLVCRENTRITMVFRMEQNIL